MTLFNPNLHGPLKLLNHHGIDGKTWFKEQGPLWVHGRDYKVAPTVFPPFSDCTICTDEILFSDVIAIKIHSQLLYMF